MGTYIDGLIETRTAGRARKMEADLHDFGLGKAWDARECLFGYGGVLALERPLFDQRAWPEDACDEVPKELGELNHSHSYAPWAEIAAVDWGAPLCDGPDANHLGEWRPGPGGELVLDDVVWAPAEVLGEAERLFGGDLFPRERLGGEVHLNGAVYRPVVVTPRMFVPPDGRRAPVGASMRALAAEC